MLYIIQILKYLANQSIQKIWQVGKKSFPKSKYMYQLLVHTRILITCQDSNPLYCLISGQIQDSFQDLGKVFSMDSIINSELSISFLIVHAFMIECIYVLQIC